MVGTYLWSLSILASPLPATPWCPPTLQEEPAPAAAANSWQGQWLIRMNRAGKRLSSQNQPTWNNLEGPALVRRASQGSPWKQRRGWGGEVTASQEASAGE